MDLSPHKPPPSFARRRRSAALITNDPYSSSSTSSSGEPRRASTFGQLSPVPTDYDIEHALRSSSTRTYEVQMMVKGEYEGRMVEVNNNNGGGGAMSAEDRYAEGLTQAIKLLSLEKSDNNPESSHNNSGSPDPEEILKEVVRNSLQALQALRLARVYSTTHRSSNGVNGMFGGGQVSPGGSSVVGVMGLYEQTAGCMNAAREVLSYAEPFIRDEQNDVRDRLLKQ